MTQDATRRNQLRQEKTLDTCLLFVYDKQAGDEHGENFWSRRSSMISTESC